MMEYCCFNCGILMAHVHTQRHKFAREVWNVLGAKIYELKYLIIHIMQKTTFLTRKLHFNTSQYSVHRRHRWLIRKAETADRHTHSWSFSFCSLSFLYYWLIDFATPIDLWLHTCVPLHPYMWMQKHLCHYNCQHQIYWLSLPKLNWTIIWCLNLREGVYLWKIPLYSGGYLGSTTSYDLNITCVELL